VVNSISIAKVGPSWEAVHRLLRHARTGPSLLNPLKEKASLTQSAADGCDVGGAAGLKGHVDHGFAQTDTIIGAIMDGFDDVGSLASQDLSERQ